MIGQTLSACPFCGGSENEGGVTGHWCSAKRKAYAERQPIVDRSPGRFDAGDIVDVFFTGNGEIKNAMIISPSCATGDLLTIQRPDGVLQGINQNCSEFAGLALIKRSGE